MRYLLFSTNESYRSLSVRIADTGSPIIGMKRLEVRNEPGSQTVSSLSPVVRTGRQCRSNVFELGDLPTDTAQVVTLVPSHRHAGI